VALFVLVQAKAFAPFGSVHHLPSISANDATWSSCCTTTSTTELYGLRNFLRRRFFPRKNVNEPQEPIKPLICEDYYTDRIRPSKLHSNESLHLHPVVWSVSTSPITSNDHIGQGSTKKSAIWSSITNNNGVTRPTTAQLSAAASATTTTSAGLTDSNEEIFREVAEPTLPPRNEAQLTTFEREYRNMLSEFLQYTKRDDIAHVRSPRLRALFAGIAASYNIPEVYRAFEILFEDYAPLRIGGRLIYAQLKQAMVEAQRERKQEVQSISQVTGLSNEEIEASRIAWLKMAVHHKDDQAAQLSIQQLIDFGLAETVAEVLGHDDFEGWLNSFNQNFTSDKVTFCELMVALQNCSVDSNRPECDPNTLLPEIAKRLGPRQNIFDVRPLCEKKKRYISKYDGMVRSFLEWKKHVPADKRSRKMDVLRGCFAGAESVEIVDALRIVYVDYSALRFAGDLIFTVMKTLVGSSRSNKLSQNNP
jgi:hypothetical protein